MSPTAANASFEYDQCLRTAAFERDCVQTMDNQPVLVTKGIYIGSYRAERNREACQREGITHILQVAYGLEPSHPNCFKYLSVDVCDAPSEDLVAHFPECFAFINEALEQNGNVLVHCAAGISRSASVIIGFNMQRNNITYNAAFKQLYSVHPWVMPNSGFKKQLREFERMGCDCSKWETWNHGVEASYGGVR